MVEEEYVRGGWWGWVVGKLRRGEKALGARGEAFAAGYLKKMGMRIIARNRRVRGGKGGEIDLIAIEGNWVVFVEVRTRASGEFMRPEDSIRYGKRRAVTRSVRRLMRRHKGAGLTARIDVVALVWPEGAREPTEVRHHRGAMAVGKW